MGVEQIAQCNLGAAGEIDHIRTYRHKDKIYWAPQGYLVAIIHQSSYYVDICWCAKAMLIFGLLFIIFYNNSTTVNLLSGLFKENRHLSHQWEDGEMKWYVHVILSISSKQIIINLDFRPVSFCQECINFIHVFSMLIVCPYFTVIHSTVAIIIYMFLFLPICHLTTFLSAQLQHVELSSQYVPSAELLCYFTSSLGWYSLL